jgi:aryl-alcohol dehydrogenase-like predicted oxidoreductase
MQYNQLGKTSIEVSKLCFGTLTTSPLQKNFAPRASAALFKEAYDRGVNFYDTAESYENYDHLKYFLQLVPRENVVITTKTYAYNKKMAEKSFTQALKAMDTDYIDIFLLHEQVNHMTIKGHFEAVKFLMEQKEKGLIKALGISTHHISGAKGLMDFDALDILHPIINYKGIGIVDGTLEAMVATLKTLKHDYNKGIYGMKPLGGGNLLNTIDQAFAYINGLDFLDAIAIGMQSIEELDYNIKVINHEPIADALKNKLSLNNRQLLIADWCTGCGKCIKTCQQQALRLENHRAVVDQHKCTLCGYCAAVCKDFCIKII